MHSHIVIRNYRKFRHLRLDFNPGMNILVGANDAGKTTLIEAITLAMTGRLHGKPLAQVLSPYLFNQDAVGEYIDALRAAENPAPPEFSIDLFFVKDTDERLRGTNNVLEEDAEGVRIRVALHPDLRQEYEVFAQDPGQAGLVPIEYYDVEWLNFAGNRVTTLSLPGRPAFIDASDVRLQNGIDRYLGETIKGTLAPEQRVRLTRAYQRLREEFASHPAITEINDGLRETSRDISACDVTLGIDVSPRSRWENGVVPHFDDLPHVYAGMGEQSMLKILLSLAQRADGAPVVLIEELESHLSFSNLGCLVGKIGQMCGEQQVFVTTHSSFVLNKLGVDRLILLSSEDGFTMDDLPRDTFKFFQKLSGYDTLRLVLAKKAILVEGPSDDLVVQRAYWDRHGKTPFEDGVDIINAGGITFKRFLDIAVRLKKTNVTIVTDNDGKDAADVRAGYDAYTVAGGVKVCVSDDTANRTLEPQLVEANGVATMNEILGLSARTSKDDLLAHMDKNKTECALKILTTDHPVRTPEYITDAVQ